jgi:sporulation protein YlmC with PRC-barrel domain
MEFSSGMISIQSGVFTLLRRRFVMFTRRYLPWFFVALFSSGLIASTMAAAEPAAADKPNANNTQAAVFKFSELKSIEVENAQGEKVGNIADLVYNARNGSISYAALSFGSTLGIGGKLFAIPWQSFKPKYNAVDKKHTLVLNIDKKALENAPGFDSKNWPDVANPAWSTDVDQFYATARTTDTRDASRTGEPGARVSDLVGLGVKNDADESLGKVEDVVVDLGQGKLRYAAIAFGGFLGMGDKLFAVPFETLRAARDRNSNAFHIVLHVNKEAMKKAPGFDKNRWPNFGDANFTADVDRFYTQNTGHRTAPGTASFKSSNIVGMRVDNPQGEHLGRIESLVMDVKSGKIRYAALSFGGFLGMGDKLFAVPWSALKIQYNTERSQNHAVLDINKTRLEKAPGFDKNHWPDFANVEWANNINSYYGIGQATQTHAGMPARRIEDIVGVVVQNPQGEDLGKLSDVVINLQTGTANYAAMSFGGFLGIGDKLFAMPWRQIDFRNDAKSQKLTAVVNVSKESLEKAPSFDKNHWPDFADPNWSRDIDRHYGEQAAKPVKASE